MRLDSHITPNRTPNSVVTIEAPTKRNATEMALTSAPHASTDYGGKPASCPIGRSPDVERPRGGGERDLIYVLIVLVQDFEPS
jgi:hypothetical protein